MIAQITAESIPWIAVIGSVFGLLFTVIGFLLVFGGRQWGSRMLDKVDNVEEQMIARAEAHETAQNLRMTNLTNGVTGALELFGQKLDAHSQRTDQRLVEHGRRLDALEQNGNKRKR